MSNHKEILAILIDIKAVVRNPATNLLIFGKFVGELFGDLLHLNQVRVSVKSTFDTIDAIIFEAALTVNAVETQYKQKEYVC